jgi:hypothetical protein
MAMASSFDSYDSWKSTYLIFSVVAGVLAIFAAISGLVAFWASSNAELAKQAPRTLTEAPQAKTTQPHVDEKQEPTVASSVLIISIGGAESEAYASEIASAIAGKAKISRFEITSMVNAPTGLAILPNGHDPKDLQNLLASIGLQAPITNEMLPIPMSALAQFSAFIALRVGLKPSR